MPVRTWETAYPIELVEHVLRVKGPAYLCNEVMRDEAPSQVQHHFYWDILSYCAADAFVGRRVLDFGSGSGASSLVLARMLPETEIVGVELIPELIELAEHRARFHGVADRVRFFLSPDANRLPEHLGSFDFVVLSAVYEHLLPRERKALLPQLWAQLKPGGILFLDETPHRWFPWEGHTTGLPLLNYLPDSLAFAVARRFSPRVSPGSSWPELLRRGIRGATPREIRRLLGTKATLLQPSRLGITDQIALWERLTERSGKPVARKLLLWSLRALRATTGITMVPMLSLAFRKEA